MTNLKKIILKYYLLIRVTIFQKKNRNFFLNLGIDKNKLFNYTSPIYNPSKIEDKKLLNMANNIKPDYVIINLAGGVQEILDFILKKFKYENKNNMYRSSNIFFTKDQAPINRIIDKFF